MPLIPVEHPDDPRLADYRNVPDPALAARSGAFIAEGRLVVRRLITATALPVRSVMVTPAALASIEDAVEARGGLPIYVVPQALMNGITGFNMHRGCLAIGERPAPLDWRALARDARRLVVLERVANADNVGSIFRNAAAFGVDAVLLGPACTDPLYRKAIRTSMAAALTLPFAHAQPWPGALCDLRQSGWTVVGSTPSASAAPLRELAGRLGPRVALVVGHEGEGLTHEALAACSHQARIPMAAGVDSLNVATATAVALYELTR